MNNGIKMAHPPHPKRSPWRALVVMFLAVSGVPSVAAGWSVPEGIPYPAEPFVIDETPRGYAELSFRDGLLAGITHKHVPGPWGIPDQTTMMLFIMEWDGESFVPVGYGFESLKATAVSTAGGVVAWRQGGQNETIELWDGQEVQTLAGPGVHSPPIVNAGAVTWSTRHGEGTASITRFDLATREVTTWDSPRGVCEPWVADVGDRFVLGAGVSCSRDDARNLVTWRPGEPVAPLSVDEDPFMVSVHGSKILWTAYRENEGRGTNVYLHNVASATESRLSASPHRECCAAMTDGLAAWLDARQDRMGPGNRAQYEVYFKDLGNANEYRIATPLEDTSQPVLDGRLMVYSDKEGRLMGVHLPGIEALLSVEPALDASGNVTLTSRVPVDVAWDTDQDGGFETPGALDPGQAPENVLGRAVDLLGRVAVLEVAPAQVKTVLPSLEPVHSVPAMMPLLAVVGLVICARRRQGLA